MAKHSYLKDEKAQHKPLAQVQSQVQAAFSLPPSQQLIPFLDMRMWLKDAIVQAVQPLVDKVSQLEEINN